MRAAERSLDWAVEKWLSPTLEMAVRVPQVHRTVRQRKRCADLRTLRSGAMVSIFFLRPEDGSWNAFPPDPKRPAMNGHHSSA
ncbi:hypothetical protein FVF58_40430 [Paraburkholderia panacisoli]|uniref:Uncharacterized protein n=1 Tax=Paraburkholderia panacisoli TaxID=2603818 RepID=A0A5B0GC49_9BURK|nr:hypothetical protein FVF58_40430 [Paraburkholderia panacisoli]